MRVEWLKRNNNPVCLLFMAGWGMGPEPFVSLVPEGVDCLFCFDYRSLEPVPELATDYERVVLLAWSMGVWVASRLLREGSFHEAVAVGGTLHPVDDRRGIPEQHFTHMVRTLDQPVLERFYRSMFDDPMEAERFLRNRPVRSLASLREELESLGKTARRMETERDIYTRNIITTRDRIFPASNQLRAWGKERGEKMRLPHFPFYQYDFFREITG